MINQHWLCTFDDFETDDILVLEYRWLDGTIEVIECRYQELQKRTYGWVLLGKLIGQHEPLILTLQHITALSNRSLVTRRKIASS